MSSIGMQIFAVFEFLIALSDSIQRCDHLILKRIVVPAVEEYASSAHADAYDASNIGD